jgi:predicted DsbA family dithiol-disulfide isomerase
MLVLHFDYPSPAATVAALRLQRLADEGLAVTFEGIDALGLNLSVPPTLDQLDELATHRGRAAELGLAMRRPSRRPPTLAAHLVGQLADTVGLGAAWRWACFRAYWSDDVDLSDEPSLLELSGGIGLDLAAVTDRLGDRELRIAARQRGLARRRRGIGGVPVLEVDGALVPADLSDDDLRQLAGT